MRGVYVPAYIYSATARSRYHALIGENYEVTRLVRDSDAQGKTTTRIRTETETEWCPLSGEHTAYVPDVLVTASKGLPDSDLHPIEPFDLRLARRMNPAFLAGWIAEEPSMSQEECLRQAREEAKAEVAGKLAQFMPGDTYKDLRFETELSEESAALALVPVWVLAAKYHPQAPPFRVLLNGQTGEVQGKAPLSPGKIAATIVLVLGIIATIVAFASGVIPWPR
jgi:hypothetical protein